MNAIKALGLLSLILIGCSSLATPNGCPSNELVCGNYCYDPTHYACKNGAIVLVSCDSNYQMCSGRCIPFPSDCCANGSYCYGELCSSNNSCRPVGTSDCGGGRYCPVGHVCINGGANCS